MAAFVIISTFGCENGLILSGPRLYYAMSRDGLFFRRASELSVRGVPAYGLLLQGIWAAVLTLSGRYGDLLDYIIMAALLFYALTVSGLFVLRRRRPDLARPYRVPGYPWLPALYVAASTAIMIDLLIVKPAYTWPGLLIVLTGIPVYFLWRRGGRASGEAQDSGRDPGRTDPEPSARRAAW
jgi:APA family basic amino acid/polyamine antiporter